MTVLRVSAFSKYMFVSGTVTNATILRTNPGICNVLVCKSTNFIGEANNYIYIIYAKSNNLYHFLNIANRTPEAKNTVNI